jgi:hypothetical protein
MSLEQEPFEFTFNGDAGEFNQLAGYLAMVGCTLPWRGALHCGANPQHSPQRSIQDWVGRLRSASSKRTLASRAVRPKVREISASTAAADRAD